MICNSTAAVSELYTLTHTHTTLKPTAAIYMDIHAFRILTKPSNTGLLKPG